MVNPLTLSYNIRHLLTRRTQTAMTVLGVALVVFVFVATLMLANGLKQTLASTGSPDNVIVLRLGAQNEIQSGISREEGAIILSQPEVAKLPNGKNNSTSDSVVLVSLRKRSDGLSSNVTVRGVSPGSEELRPGIRLSAGRLPTAGTREVMVGTAIRKKFTGTDVGQNLRLVGTDWNIVGIFDAGNSGFSSEVWGDADVMIPAFRRERFSSVTFRLAPGVSFPEMKKRLEEDRRLTVSVQREQEFYASQSENLALFIKILGTFISIVFSLGAIIGAMITMYGAVANRIREIGILRALGFSRSVIFRAFAKECVLLSLFGGIVGVLAAFALTAVSVTTTNFQTFSEVAFAFRMTPQIAIYGLLFSAIMGFVGGALPAFRASRLQILDALRMR